MTNLTQFYSRYQAGERGIIKILADQGRALLRPDRVFESTHFLTAGDIESLYLTGIWKSLKSYDPAKKTKFSTYLKYVVTNEFISEIRKYSFRKRWPIGGGVRTGNFKEGELIAGPADCLADQTERARFRAVRRIYWKLRRQEENMAAEIFVFRQVFPKVAFRKVNKLFRVKNAGYHFWKAKKFRQVVIEEAENICLLD